LDDKGTNRHKHVDEHGYEEIDEDEMHALVLEAQLEALQSDNDDEKASSRKHRFPKWIFWLLTFLLFFNTFSFIFQIYSIPAIDFLKTSAKLSTNEKIASYSKSIVTITTADSKGTGFSISDDGQILTNYHVIDGYTRVTVAFPEAGRFTAKVVSSFPAIDLAVLKIEANDLPYLPLATEPLYNTNEPVTFIGNPLSFEGIANEGTIIDTLRLSDWTEDVVMIDAPVYRGNSGSPVIDNSGEVIGIIFATLEHPEHRKVGLFIPISLYEKAMATIE
jgi:S1-C subfamily serine protease